MSTVVDLSTLKREDVKVVDDSLDTALAQTIADYEARTKKTLQPAHIERLLINTYAYRESLARQKFNEAYRQQHPRFATGVMLDLCGDDVSTPRLSAKPALTTLRFSVPSLNTLTSASTGVTQIIVPKGARAAVGELMYETSESSMLTVEQNSVDLIASCTTAGTAGNGWSIGQVNTLVTPLHPLFEVQVSNVTVPAGGVENEEDDPYRERVLLAPESFSIGGTVGAYKYFARKYSPTICDVEVTYELDSNAQPIGGTVAIVVLTQTGMPSGELLTSLNQYFAQERFRILCDKPITRAPEEINYTIDAVLVLLTGTNESEAKSKAAKALDDFLQARRQKLGGDVVPLDIQTVLKVTGVYNVILNNLSLITVNKTQWARCTSINISVASEQVDG